MAVRRGGGGLEGRLQGAVTRCGYKVRLAGEVRREERRIEDAVRMAVIE